MYMLRCGLVMLRADECSEINRSGRRRRGPSGSRMPVDSITCVDAQFVAWVSQSVDRSIAGHGRHRRRAALAKASWASSAHIAPHRSRATDGPTPELKRRYGVGHCPTHSIDSTPSQRNQITDPYHIPNPTQSRAAGLDISKSIGTDHAMTQRHQASSPPRMLLALSVALLLLAPAALAFAPSTSRMPCWQRGPRQYQQPSRARSGRLTPRCAVQVRTSLTYA